MKLVVNIPAYNEAKSIGQTIQRIRESFQSDFYQTGKGRIITQKIIQVVNDGSTDDTALVAQKAGADTIISHDINRKLGIAFRTGVEGALKQGADFMINIDADGQFDPNDIPQLLEPIISHQADMVVASRFGKHRATNIPWIKEFLNRLAAKIIGFFLGHPIDDLTCGFRAHNRETLLRLNLSSVFTYTQETIIDAIGKNLKVVWVPVKVTYFADRKSKMTHSILKFINNSFKIILKAIRDVRPLKFFGWPGLFFVFFGLIGFSFFLYFYFQEFKIRPFLNYIIFSSVSIMLGIQLIIFALIADMIKTNRQINEELFYRIKKDLYNKDISN